MELIGATFALVLAILGFVLAIVWLIFPFLVLGRLKKIHYAILDLHSKWAKNAMERRDGKDAETGDLNKMFGEQK